MQTRKNLAAIVMMVVTLVSASAFADSRHRTETSDREWTRARAGHATVEGRIRDIDRERNGFVIDLAGQRVRLFAPVQTDVRADSRGRTRVRDLNRGDWIRATGPVDARGRMLVQRIVLLRDRDDRGRNDVLYGVIEQIDSRRGFLYLSVDSSRRTVAVDARRIRGYRNGDLSEFRRGDRVTITGDWDRQGEFEASRIELDRRW